MDELARFVSKAENYTRVASQQIIEMAAKGMATKERGINSAGILTMKLNFRWR